MTPPNEVQFEAFPPAVKRKYFSTLERLRLAQHPVGSNTILESSPRSRRLTKSCKGHPKPTTRRHPCYLSCFYSRRSKTSLVLADVSQEDAQWFQRLPDKVRRKQFTKEEQLILAGRRESVILDAADEVLYKLGGRQANQSLPSLQSSSSTLLSGTSIEAEESVYPAVDMDKSMLDSFRWLEDEDLDLTLDDYHVHVAETAVSAAKQSSRRPSFRRALSLNSVSFGRDSSSSAVRPPTSATSFSPADTSIQASYESTKSRAAGVKHVTQSARGSFDRAAKHYQDPEARLKLRVYLASPQKFDEAIEFGFPSLENPVRPASRRQSVSNRQRQSSSVDAQTFFDDGNASLFDDQDDDEEGSLPDPDSPDTPLDVAFRNTLHSSSSKPSPTEIDDYRSRPDVWHRRSEPYAHTLTGNREMTLRMTLTRQDLRADESILYRQGHDPFALEELPPVTDGGDIWMKPMKDGGMVKKIWRRVSGKS